MFSKKKRLMNPVKTVKTSNKTVKKTSTRTDGIALIATILILAMCFSSLLTVLSLTSLSLKRGGKTQYHSYQALLAAESGVNSFRARSSETLFDSSKADVSLDSLNNWLENNNLNDLVLLEGSQSNQSIQSTLRFSNVTPQSATLESVGSIQQTQDDGSINTLAKKVLRVDFKLHAVGSKLRIQPSAALTTLGELDLEGYATLTGAPAQAWSGLIRNYDEARANPTPLPNSKKFQLRIQHPNRFHSGQVIELNSGRYKVTTVDKNANTLELQPLSPKSSEHFSDGEIALIPLALSGDIPKSNAKTASLPITNSQAQALAIGHSIAVGGYAATIDSIGDSAIAITWTSSVPTNVLPEGSLVSLGILGARAAQAISSAIGTTIVSGKEERANLNITSLFQDSFGVTKDDLLGLLNSYNQRSGKSFEFKSANELQSTTKLNGLYYTEENLYFNSANPLCGNGIIISSVDVVVDHVCDDGFSGLLYIFGNYSQSGGHIEGAVISEQSMSLTSEPTRIRANASISYNPNAFNAWHNYLQDEIALQDGKQSFQQVVGSWRLQ